MDKLVLQSYINKKYGLEIHFACADLLTKINVVNVDSKKQYYNNCIRKAKHLYKHYDTESILENSIELDNIGADLLS